MAVIKITMSDNWWLCGPYGYFLYLNGIKVGKLKSREIFELSVDAGNHELRVRKPFTPHGSPIIKVETTENCIKHVEVKLSRLTKICLIFTPLYLMFLAVISWVPNLINLLPFPLVKAALLFAFVPPIYLFYFSGRRLLTIQETSQPVTSSTSAHSLTIDSS